MTKCTTRQLVNFLLDCPPDMALEKRFDRAAQRWPSVTVAELARASAVALDQIEEGRKQDEHDLAEMKEVMAIMEGCPKVAVFRDVVAIKAKQGDPLALKWSSRLNSRGYRKHEALMKAAWAAHPEFEIEKRGARWIGRGEPPSSQAVLEWFQINHPAKAREIERGYEQGKI